MESVPTHHPPVGGRYTLDGVPKNTPNKEKRTSTSYDDIRYVRCSPETFKVVYITNHWLCCLHVCPGRVYSLNIFQVVLYMRYVEPLRTTYPRATRAYLLYLPSIYVRVSFQTKQQNSNQRLFFFYSRFGSWRPATEKNQRYVPARTYDDCISYMYNILRTVGSFRFIC